jgi:hypothetical protein
VRAGIVECFQWCLQQQDGTVGGYHQPQSQPVAHRKGQQQPVSQVVIMALINISVNIKCREKIGRSGIFSFLLPALDKSSIETTRQWCMLINNLSANSADNKALLGAEGICESIVHIIHEFIKHKTVVVQAVCALKNLSSVVENTARIFSAEGCDTLLLCIQEYGHIKVASKQSGSNNVFSIIEKVATTIELLVLPPENGYILLRLVDLDVIQQLQACLFRYKEYYSNPFNEQFDSVPTVEEASGSKRRPTGRTNSSSSYYGIAMSQENGNATISTNNGTSSASVLSLVEEHLRVFADLLQQQQNSSFT